MKEETEELIKKSRESQKHLEEVIKAYLEKNSQNLKQVLFWYKELVEAKKQEYEVLSQLTYRYKEISRNIKLLTGALVIIFSVVFHDFLYHIGLIPLQFMQYIYVLYQQATPGEKLSVLFLLIGGIVGWVFNNWFSKKN